MAKTLTSFSVEKALYFTQKNFASVAYLTSNQTNGKEILAFGEKKGFLAEKTFVFDDFQQFLDKNEGFKLGFLTYDLKNVIEKLSSVNDDKLNFPLAYFFVPQHLFIKENNHWQMLSDSKGILSEIEAFSIGENDFPKLQFKDNISRENYIEKVKEAKQEIRQGNVYELNFCHELFTKNADINPVSTFLTINAQMQAPFSAFFKYNKHYALSFSPERYLKKEGKKLTSQPIKGTTARGKTLVEDEQNKARLKNSPKEQNENVMIVDLVRNDLSRTAAKNSVQVEELFGIYTYPSVHQMISTISSEIKEGINISDIIKTTFPMGSMTGAPKISAMQIIERLETTKRGLYSGAIGYITPENDFDFNVVIRSLLYNKSSKYLSLMVGSAITDMCVPEEEYEETQLKAKKILDFFS